MKNVLKMVMLAFTVVLLSQCNSSELNAMRLRYMESRNNALADYLKGKQDGYILVLRTLANIMADYENVPAEERRGRYDQMLLTVLRSETEITTLFTVWKPNSIDGLDSRRIAYAGSGPSGQYALTFTNDSGLIEMGAVAGADIDTIMEYINGPNANKDRVEEPVLVQLNGRDKYLIRMTVPIVVRRTNETIGIVGCLLDIDLIQKFLEQALMYNNEIAAMSVYSNNGFILASYVPERIGKNMIDVDTIYGEHLKDAEQAVLQGMNFHCLSYSPVLRSNVAIFMSPVSIGNSDTTWSVMIASTEEYFKRRSLLNFR
jgi:methyl-accepting chemotaxis protein